MNHNPAGWRHPDGKSAECINSECVKTQQWLVSHKSPAAEAGEVARNQALKISRLFHEKIKTMVEIKL